MNRINKTNNCSGVFTRLMLSLVILASLLILPKAQAAIGETFIKDQLKYTVYSEDKAAKTGTVSVEPESREILGDIVIPESVRNSEYIYSITIFPSSVFEGCSRLKSITIPSSITSISDNAFSECGNLVSITIPNRVVSIGNNAFGSCTRLTNITIPDSVTSIGWGAFSGCSSLTSIIVPGNVTSIKDGVFYACRSLTNVVISNNIISIGNRAFHECISLNSIIIPERVTSIGENAFDSCQSLTNITIPNSVTFIGEYAFQYCSSLNSITIPNSVTSIGGWTFTGCVSLASVTIPTSVTYIEGGAFSNCNSLTAVYFEGNAPNTGGAPFSTPAVIYYRPGTKGWTNPWCGRPATLWIEAPQIEEQPKSQAVLEGDSVTFTVSAEGTAPLNYQWYKDDVAIEGAISETYAIESVTAEDLGNYQVVVTNTEGKTVSNVAVLSLLQPPTIIVNPVSVTVDNGTNVVFTVEALNADSYQWYKDGTAISGATETTYSIEYVKGSDVGTYTAMAINRGGAEKSSPAALSLTQPYRATAELQMVNGFIVGITVTDCGWGYEFEPKVRIKDEFGEGAEAHCIVENGMVTAIILDNPGSGYSEETTVKVGSPFKYVGLKAEVKQIKLTLYLVLGETYQLEACTDLSTHDWKRIGEPFIADEEETEVVVEVLETGRYFRVHEVK